MDEATWKELQHKVTIKYTMGQDREWVRDQTMKALEEIRRFYGYNNPYLRGLVTKEEQEREINKHLNQALDFLGHARDNYDLPSVPAYLPYSPINTFFNPPILQQQNVNDMRVFLQQLPYNWPQSPGDNVNDWANAAQLPLRTLLQYKHLNTPPSIVKRIRVTGKLADRSGYDPTTSVEENYSFFSDNAGNAQGVQWNLEFMSASQLRYTTPAEPDTYPNNRLLYWNNTAKLTAVATKFYRSASPNQYGATIYPANPPEENILHWVFEMPKGVLLQTNDMLQLTTGYPTTVNGAPQFDKLYITADLEVINFNWNSIEMKKVVSVLITMLETPSVPVQENLTIGCN